jgi:hypothetical protein
MSIDVDWENFCGNNITVIVSRGWRVGDLDHAMCKERELAKQTGCAPHLLIIVKDRIGIPPPRLLSWLRRLYPFALPKNRKIVVCASAHQITYLQNLLFAACPQLLGAITWATDCEQAIDFIKPQPHAI